MEILKSGGMTRDERVELDQVAFADGETQS